MSQDYISSFKKVNSNNTVTPSLPSLPELASVYGHRSKNVCYELLPSEVEEVIRGNVRKVIADKGLPARASPSMTRRLQGGRMRATRRKEVLR